MQESGAAERLGEFGALYALVNRLTEEDVSIREAVLVPVVRDKTLLDRLESGQQDDSR